jgi:hypothetical protein
MTLELFQPQTAVQLGTYSFAQGIALEVFSSKNSYFDWAKIRFTEQFQPKVDIAVKAPALVELGYADTLETIFSGYVATPYNGGGSMNEVILKDDMLLLEETIINNTFLNTTPQEMISYFLGQAGASKMVLSSQAYPERRQLPIRRMSVIQAIETVHAAWSIQQPFFFSEGVFYWGELPKQEKIYTFEYGVNILSLSRENGEWTIETIAAPFVKHSHKIQVVHPTLSGDFEVSKVHFQTNDSGFIRTYISF